MLMVKPALLEQRRSLIVFWENSTSPSIVQAEVPAVPSVVPPHVEVEVDKVALEVWRLAKENIPRVEAGTEAGTA